ncbi:hypothetical protein DQ04_02651010 [Trypanosoma grayi]|uniref:hypothetical protein n=1 Tax=Trypanosoma grayi TaxID=71804 RepID=UPI0004F46B80|nr:hypothetical protein DQ04_02651010 [Trypanosoma grayi]KEG11403.1 hypothetical protein DQ04_02651010 [Trypanosoma grayi]
MTTKLSDDLSSCAILIVYAGSKEIYFSNRKSLEAIASRVITIVLLAEPLSPEETPPPSSHHVVLSVATATFSGESKSFFEHVLLESMAVAMENTNGCICADDIAFSSNDRIKLSGSSNPVVIRKMWGSFGPDVVFRCFASVRAEKDAIVDGITVGGLLKIVLPKARVQILPERLQPSLIFLVSPQGRQSALEAMQSFAEHDCSLSFEPDTGESRLEVTCNVDPQTVLDEVQNCISEESLLDIRVAYSFEVLSSTRTFPLLQAIAAHHRVPDEELGVAIEQVSMCQFAAMPFRQIISPPVPLEIMGHDTKDADEDVVYTVGVKQLHALLTEIVRKEVGAACEPLIQVGRVNTKPEPNQEDNKHFSGEASLNEHFQVSNKKSYIQPMQAPEIINFETMRSSMRWDVEGDTADMMRKNQPPGSLELSLLMARLDQMEAKLQSTEMRLANLTNIDTDQLALPLAALRADISDCSTRMVALEKVAVKYPQLEVVSSAVSDLEKWKAMEADVQSLKTRLSEVMQTSGILRGELDFVSAGFLRRLENLEKRRQPSLPSLPHATEGTVDDLRYRLKSLEEETSCLVTKAVNFDRAIAELQQTCAPCQGEKENMLEHKLEALSQKMENLLEEALQALQQHSEMGVRGVKKELFNRLDKMTDTWNEKFEHLRSILSTTQAKDNLWQRHEKKVIGGQ